MHENLEKKRCPALKIVWLLCLCVAVTGCLGFSKSVQAESSSFVVVLDPWHDSLHARGSNAASGIVEENMNLEIAMACKKELEAAGIKVYMTRNFFQSES